MNRLAEISKAIRDNGIPQIKGNFIRVDAEGEVTGACAIGQAAINLKAEAYGIVYELDQIGAKEGLLFVYSCPDHPHYYSNNRSGNFSLAGIITHMNDYHDKTYAEIADYLDQTFNLVAEV